MSNIERVATLSSLLESHLSDMSKPNYYLTFIAGVNRRAENRITEITRLSGLPSPDDTKETLAAVDLICIGSKNFRQVEERLETAYGRVNLQRAAEPARRRVDSAMSFMRLAASKTWSLRQERKR